MVQFTEQQLIVLFERLHQHYGNPTWQRWREPVGELVRTILSHNTTDKNSLRAYANLIEKYPTWEALLQANEDEIAEIVRIGGLANAKAKKIKKSLLEIHKREGRIDLEFLHQYSLEQAKEYLLSLNGVGPKTAACILIFSFNFPYMPVDTHIHRVSNRLGLVAEKSREKTQEKLNEIIPEKEKYSFHLNVIEHGRKVCKATSPFCTNCFLSDICNFYQKVVKEV